MTPFLCIRIVLVENYSCIFDTSAIQDGRMSREDTTAWMQDAYIDVGGRECREHILEVERIRTLTWTKVVELRLERPVETESRKFEATSPYNLLKPHPLDQIRLFLVQMIDNTGNMQTKQGNQAKSADFMHLCK